MGYCWSPVAGCCRRGEREGCGTGIDGASWTCRAGSFLGEELEIASITAGGTCGPAVVEREIAERARRGGRICFLLCCVASKEPGRGCVMRCVWERNEREADDDMVKALTGLASLGGSMHSTSHRRGADRRVLGSSTGPGQGVRRR